MTAPRSQTRRSGQGSTRRPARAGPIAILAAGVLLTSCASQDAPCQRSRPDPGCPDLRFEGRSYAEWHPLTRPDILQEIGDGTYPACNRAGRCSDTGVGGHGATDVWRLEGVDPRRAVIGLREDTDTYVVFVAVGTDPRTLRQPTHPGRTG
jgi:hypothetical protein